MTLAPSDRSLNMRMVNLYRASGNVVPINPIRRASVSAKHICRFLGEAFYLVPLDQSRIMVVQGAMPKKTRLPFNQRATSLYQRSLRFREAPANEHPVIRGDVLVAQCKDLELTGIVRQAKLIL